MKQFFTLLFLLIFSSGLKAQITKTIKGSVKDSSGLSVIGGLIKLNSLTDSLSAGTDADGRFEFRNVKASNFLITISALGYQPVKKRFILDPKLSVYDLDAIVLKTDSRMLNEVLISGVNEVTVKEDTLEYRSDQYKLQANSLAEDLLKKLPGLEVDRDGNVTAQGKQVTRVRINGKDFFGGDVKTATQQIPAELIDKVQVIDDYGEQARITGVKEDESEKILNFTIKPERNKGFNVRGTIGGGTENRYQTSVFGMSFNNDQQFSVLGNLNNTNASIFNLANGGGGGGRRGGNFGGGNNQSNGLTNVNSVGFNYREDWGKKITAYGNYRFSNRENNTISNSYEERIQAAGTIINQQFQNNTSKNINHRVNFNIEYKIDTLNYLKISPSFSYGDNINANNNNFDILNSRAQRSAGTYVNNSDAFSPEFETEIFYNHRFGAKPRNLSFNGRLSNIANNQDQDFITLPSNTIDQEITLYQRRLTNIDNNNDNYRARISYNEPLSLTSNLEFNYTYSLSSVNNNRLVSSANNPDENPVTDINRSNQYRFNFVRNRFALLYRVNQKKYNYQLGLAVQPTLLTGNSLTFNTVTNTKDVNIAPTARFSYKFSKTKELNFNYNASSNQPDYLQLQPVLDDTNPQFTSIGNPNLKAEFTNNINLRYNNFDFKSGNTFLTNVSLNFSKNRIVQNIIDAPPGTEVIQRTEYLNANGYYALSGFYSFTKPISNKKYTIGLRGFANQNNNVSYLNSVLNSSKNLVLSQRLNFQINPVEALEITPAVNYTYNRVNNSLNEALNSQVNYVSLSLDHKIEFLKGFVWGGTVDKTLNYGFNTINQNPLIINSYLEKQFFKGKAGSLRFQAFDLLNQNTSINRIINTNGFTDSRSNRLAQYFMLSFTMRIQKYAGVAPQTDDFRPGFRRQRNEEMN